MTNIELELAESKIDDLKKELQKYPEDATSFSGALALLGSEVISHLTNDEIYNVLGPKASFSDIATLRSSPSKRDKLEVGESYWAIYKKQIRESICSENGDLFKLFMREGKISTKALITALASTVGLGSAYIGIICGLAIILMELGLKSFCEWTKV